MPGTRLGSLGPSSSSPSTARETRRDTMRPLRREDMEGRYEEKREWALLMGVPMCEEMPEDRPTPKAERCAVGFTGDGDGDSSSTSRADR